MNYNEISAEFVSKFFGFVDAAKRVVITCHRSPDGDAISSVLALYEVLKLNKPSKEILAIISSDPLERYSSLKNYDKIQFVADISKFLDPSDTLVVLDGSQYHRFSTQPEIIQKVATRICIDHHASPIDEFTLSLVIPNFPACAELIYHTFCQNNAISKELAEIFMMGILSDTGTIAFLKPSQSETLTTVKKLMDTGQINIQDFLSRYESIGTKEFEIVQELVKNTSYGSQTRWPDFQFSFVSRTFIEQGKYTELELKAGTDIYKASYLRKIDCYTWGFAVRPEGEDISISMRSLPGSVNVRDMLERMQLGGGHDRAAGGTLKANGKQLDSQDAIRFVLDWMKNNGPLLS